MKTIEKRDLNLTLLTEQSQIIDFLNDMKPSDFVELHQNYFKDHYLKPSPVNFDTDIFNDLDLAEIIADKYRDFFSDLGLRASYRWLNPYSEDFTLKMILAEVDGEDYGEEVYEYSTERFNDLYYDIWSGSGLSWFAIEVIRLYKEEAA